MVADKIFPVYINPLAFLEVDEPWADLQKKPVTHNDVLEFICRPSQDRSVDTLVSRYKEISTEPKRLFAAPAEERILDKLVWPLKNAKASYMIENYLGTIALAGMVSEMVAILMYELAEFTLNQKPVTEAKQRSLFGSTFEKLGQTRRVQVLSSLDFIDDETESAFKNIRMIRRNYLHLWSQDHTELPKDAISAFQSAVSLIIKVIGQDIEDGKIRLNPAMARYLEKKGLYRNKSDESA
ncbi:MAG: hypothetical protein IIA60_02090 [Candidatus Marinimicrobia bacterium]|nr:hypothetical protein [Candidatus Neomarinimicrobiota bacterium]